MEIENKTFREIQAAFDKAEKYDILQEAKGMAENHEHEQKAVHFKTVLAWIRNTAIAAVVVLLTIVVLQVALGGFEGQIVTDSLAYITQPLALVLYSLIGLGALISVLYFMFPILTTFINEKVNTVSLSTEFLKASPESKLDFLAKIVLALSILIGLTFTAAKGQTCIVQTAKAEIGTLEEKGVNNYGQRIDVYRSAVYNKKVSKMQDPWCGYFVGYVLKTCGVETKHVTFLGRARDYFKTENKIVFRKNFKYGVIKPTIKGGYLVGYMFNSGTIGHVGIVETWNWNTNEFTAIEGNTSNLNTVYRDANKRDGVRLKRRKIASAYIISKV